MSRADLNPKGTPTTGQVTAEVFLIPTEEDRTLVYAPHRRTAFVANPGAVAALQRIDTGEPVGEDQASQDFAAFCRELGIVDGEPEVTPVEAPRSGPPIPTDVSLFLTTACNLRCTYCYAAAGDTPRRSMSLETAKRGIDYVARNAARLGVPAFEIAYHGGGEPSVNWNVLTESHAYASKLAKELGLNVFASCATNGVLRDDQIDWIVAHLDGVSLSYDGLPSVQDTHRLTVRGTGSSAAVAHTLRRFDERAFPYGLRVTVTHDQIRSLADSIDYIFREFRPQRVQVEPAYQLGRWSEAPSAETTEFISAYRAAQERARGHGSQISYSAARVDVLTTHFCGITQDSFALSPDGNVSSCYEAFSEDNPLADVFFYGKPTEGESGYTFDQQRLDNLRRQTVDHREHCEGCFAKWHCAGDCHHKALANDVAKDGVFRGTERCHITRALVQDQIAQKVRDSGGLLWHDPDGESHDHPGEDG